METGAQPVWGPPNTAPPSTPSAQSSRVHSIHWWVAVFRVSKATAPSSTRLAQSSRVHSIHRWAAVFRVSKAATYLISTYPHLVCPWSTHPPVSTVIQGMLHLPGGRQWSGCQRPSHTGPPTCPHSNCPHGTTTLLLAAVAGIQLRGPKSIRCLHDLPNYSHLICPYRPVTPSLLVTRGMFHPLASSSVGVQGADLRNYPTLTYPYNSTPSPPPPPPH